MKRTITLLTLLLFTGLMLPSCGLTVVKRQHTGGYYVSTNSRNHAADKDKNDKTAEIRTEESQVATATEAENEAEAIAVVTTPATETNEQYVVSDETQTAQTDDAAVPAEKMASSDRAPLLTTMTSHLPMAKKMESTTKKMKAHSSARSDGGLSLFWIVILVLLILWALGLLGGGWGLGGLIYILLVVALILLILWLLRIV